VGVQLPLSAPFSIIYEQDENGKALVQNSGRGLGELSDVDSKQLAVTII
jgi:hypothetical protein